MSKNLTANILLKPEVNKAHAFYGALFELHQLLQHRVRLTCLIQQQPAAAAGIVVEQPIMDRNEAISSYLHLLHKINEFINGSSAMCEFILASSKETLIYDFFKALTIDNRHSRRCCDFKNRCTCVVHILMFYIYIPTTTTTSYCRYTAVR